MNGWKSKEDRVRRGWQDERGGGERAEEGNDGKGNEK